MDRRLIVDAKVDEWRQRPFAYSSADCCQFAADVVLAVTGADHRASFPAYADQAEADMVLAGAGGMAGLLSSVLGESMHPSRAVKGDIVLCDFGMGETAAVCLGITCCAPGPNGLLFRPMRRATLAWRVE